MQDGIAGKVGVNRKIMECKIFWKDSPRKRLRFDMKYGRDRWLLASSKEKLGSSEISTTFI